MYRICNLIVNTERTWPNRKLRIRVLATRVFTLKSRDPSCLLSIIKNCIGFSLLSFDNEISFFFSPKQYRRAILKKANKSPGAGVSKVARKYQQKTADDYRYRITRGSTLY